MADNDDLGTDIACVDDVDANLSMVSGRRGLAEAVARRLQTPMGALWYDKHYGFDLRFFIGTSYDDAYILAGIHNQCMQEERIVDVSADVSRNGSALEIQIFLTDDEGTFDLTLAVTADNVELLKERLNL